MRTLAEEIAFAGFLFIVPYIMIPLVFLCLLADNCLRKVIKWI